MLENLFNSPFLTSLALTLLHFLWQGVLVATVLKSALLIFNNNKPQLRYALSALAMLVNLLLPIITFIILYRIELSSVNTTTNSLVISEFIEELKRPDALFSYKELTESLPILLPYIAILWLAAITLLAGKLLIEISTVNRLPQQGVIDPSHKLQQRFEELVKQIHLKITPRLLISLKVEVPMAIGWLKPVVLLPASMITGLNNAQLEMLILHELAHIRRHDYLVNFLQTLVEILLFFHPAVLWVSKQMRNEREYCSDDIAVQHCGDAIAYAHTLADTASLCTKAHHHTIPDMAMAASGGDLKQRVIRLVGHHCAPKNNISKWFASAAIIFSVLLLSSKQLLTMPLLDIWHSENPWEHSNQVSAKRTDVNENFNTTRFEGEKIIEPTSDSSANRTIAQQLLTSPQLVSVKSEPAKQNKFVHKVALTKSPIPAPANLSSDNNGAAEIEMSKKTLIIPNKSLAVTDETAHFTAQLDNLASKLTKQPQAHIEKAITNNSPMVENAFERTHSKNPYQQELTQLATSQTSEVAPREQLQTVDKIINTKDDALFVKSSNTKAPSQLVINKPSTNLPVSLSEIDTKHNLTAESDILSTWQNATQLESVDPIYPSAAKRKGIEIEVKVDFIIDEKGQIRDITFDRQNKINYFKNAIRSAMKKWRFLPAKVDDKPVESQMTKVFAFSLQS